MSPLHESNQYIQRELFRQASNLSDTLDLKLETMRSIFRLKASKFIVMRLLVRIQSRVNNTG